MRSFTIKIKNGSGNEIGKFSGTICDQLREVFATMGLRTDPELMNHWNARIPGGFQFPCAVLSDIKVHEEHEDKGHGTRAIEQFNMMAKNEGCVMGVVHIGWVGDPVKIKKQKNLWFYKKTGWTDAIRQHEGQQHLGYRHY